LSRITILALGGTDEPVPKARARSDVLEGISRRTPIPHLFIIDRDERSVEAMKALASLGDRLVVLERRELENYLLVPRAILAAMAERFETSPKELAKVSALSEEDLERAIHQYAEDLYGEVVVKRIRAELGGLAGGFVDRATILALGPLARRASLAAAVRRTIKAKVDPMIARETVEKAVTKIQRVVSREWARKQAPLKLAPGADILARLFSQVGGTYDKRQDGERIARHMRRNEIADELQNILKKAASLVP
jgi:hypothetical protein